jgi:hypothetical protein
MIPPLTLIRATHPAPVVSAGWLASTDPLEWLREIAHCRRQGCEVAVFPVATSLSDPRPAGIFLLPAGAVPTFRPRVQRLAEISPGVHAPLDAVLSAGLSEQERDYFFRIPSISSTPLWDSPDSRCRTRWHPPGC